MEPSPLDRTKNMQVAKKNARLARFASVLLDECGDLVGEAGGLVQRHEGARVGDPDQARVRRLLLQAFGSPDIRQVDGIRKTVTTRLQVWHNPRIASATAASDFDVRDLRRRPMTIYVAVAPGDIPRMAPLLRLFFDQLVNLNTVNTPQLDPNLSVQTLVLLDEFARLGRVDSLSHAAQFVRGYGMRLAFVVQNKAQLRELYGEHGAADIFDNLGAEVVFGTGDLELDRSWRSASATPR